MPAPDASCLRGEILAHYDYDRETGVFTHRHAGPNRYPGKVAGTITKGYRYIWLGDRKYRANRLAWLIEHGEWPKRLIDHRDRNRGNDAIGNLRQASNSLNMANRKTNANSVSGVKGVRFSVRKDRWVARIQKDGRRTELGYFKTKDAAAAAYADAAKRLFGDYA